MHEASTHGAVTQAPDWQVVPAPQVTAQGLAQVLAPGWQAFATSSPPVAMQRLPAPQSQSVAHQPGGAVIITGAAGFIGCMPCGGSEVATRVPAPQSQPAAKRLIRNRGRIEGETLREQCLR